MKRNPYRSIMAGYAKREGICTQCFARPADTPHVQCASCIGTNKRKKSTSSRAKERRELARAMGICTRCFKRPPQPTKSLCKQCVTDTNKAKPTTAKPIGRNKQREYDRRYKHKKLVEKVRKLDMIKYAIDNDREL